MTQPIWYDSTEAGAPTLNNVAGSLLEVLRACLINGFGAKTVTSISVSAGVATATCAAHGFADTYGKLLLIAGATEPLLNGRKQPGNVTTNSFDFPAPGVADGTYTGSMSARRAPLGWLEAYTGTDRAIFQRSAPEATNVLLRVLDTAAAPASATSARVLMVRSASDADTFAQQAPVASVLSGAGGFLHKGANSATAKQWVLVGDHLGFWLMTPFNTYGASQLNVYHFGDLNPLDAVDNNRAVLFASSAEYDGSYTNADILRNTQPAGNTHSASVSMASRDGSVAGQGVLPWGTGPTNTGFGGSNYPAPGVDVPIVGPIWAYTQSAQSVPRGTIRGMAQALANAPFSHLSIQQAGDIRFLNVVSIQNINLAQVLINLTGPW